MKRLPIIRYIRYYIATIRFNRWWKSMNGYYITPNPYDLKYLEDIREGRA